MEDRKVEFYRERFEQTKARHFSFWLQEPAFHLDETAGILTLTATLRCTAEHPVRLADFSLKIGDTEHPFTLTGDLDPAVAAEDPAMEIRIEIAASELEGFEQQNLVCLCRKSPNSILYDGADESYERRHSPFLRNREKGLIAYFRESISGKLMFTVREERVTDSPEAERLMEKAEKRAAFLEEHGWGKTPIMMYEKLGRYEESASVLFERLIDEGYKNVWFVADKGKLPKGLAWRYRRHIVQRFSFRHYLLYFRARTYLSSEQIVHAVDMDCQSFPLWAHCRQGYGEITHVHLQHGIMYMLSLRSAALSGSRKGAKVAFYREIYVASSEKELRHFMEEGGYDREEIYLAGLPKLDRARLNEGADKIVIMPTWRPWEKNEARLDPENTTYYRFLRRMTDAVPEELRDKVIVLPHPFFASLLKDKGAAGEELAYDRILRDTKLLVTDYSSIAYDAFYRGSNVVFDWSEKDACMKEYGANSSLKLSEEDAFGEICRTEEALTEAIRRAYAEPQRQEYIDNFRTIVAFHDGRNCDRVIECLKKDGIL